MRERRWFEIARFLMQEEPCELTAVLFDGVDRLQHLCYHLLDPRLASQATQLRHSTSTVCVSSTSGNWTVSWRRLSRWPAPRHKFSWPQTMDLRRQGDQIFYANAWLQQHGYLEWAEGIPIDEEGRLALDENTESSTLLDWSSTTAFALTSSSNAIFIRQAQTPGAPGVCAEEYAAFRKRLIESLLAFTDPKTGQPVIERVLTREEAFPGRHIDKAPDLTLFLREPGFLSILRANAPLQPRRSPYGAHHPHGIFLGCGPGIRTGEKVSPFSIVEMAPTLLYSLGLPIPSDMEGTPVLSAFTPAFVAAHPICMEAPDQPQEALRHEPEQALLPAAEEAQIIERLKALGYLQ